MTEIIDVNRLQDLPVLFQSYSGDTKVDRIIEQYKLRCGKEPSIMYRYKMNKVNFIAIEIVKKEK